jgi:hypothetical protein
VAPPPSLRIVTVARHSAAALVLGLASFDSTPTPTRSLTTAPIPTSTAAMIKHTIITRLDGQLRLLHSPWLTY